MKTTKERLLITGLRILCVVALLASSSAMAADVDLKKAIFGKWLGPGGQTIEFFIGGSVIAQIPQDGGQIGGRRFFANVVHGRYEVFGNDPTRVQQNEISVQMTDSEDALPFTAKLASPTEMFLMKSTGETSKFIKVK